MFFSNMDPGEIEVILRWDWHMGISINGGTIPQNRWRLLWKIPTYKWIMNMGYPHIGYSLKNLWTWFPVALASLKCHRIFIWMNVLWNQRSMDMIPCKQLSSSSKLHGEAPSLQQSDWGPTDSETSQCRAICVQRDQYLWWTEPHKARPSSDWALRSANEAYLDALFLAVKVEWKKETCKQEA